MARTVVGLFDDHADAQDAVRDLEGMGFTREQVSIVAKDREGIPGGVSAVTGAGDLDDAAATGAGTGAVAGAGIGGAVGLLAGLGALAIPGFGPVIAAGPIMAAITGAGVGAAAGAGAGGLIGALTEVGVPDEQASYYEEGVRQGGTLVTVSANDGQAQQAVDVMRRHNVVDIDRRSQDYTPSGATGRAGYTAGAAGTGANAGTDNVNRGYGGVATGSNAGYEVAESDLATGGNADAARSNAGLGYTAGATGAGNPTGHSWSKDEEVGADADYSGAGAAVNHGYTGINADPPTGGGYASGGNFGEDAGQGAVDAGVRDSSRQPDYNNANSRELAGVAHEEMPNRDDMRSTIPDTRTTSDSAEEDLGDTDHDLKRARPGATNVY